VTDDALEVSLIALGQSLRRQSREEKLAHQRIRRQLFARPQQAGEADPQRKPDAEHQS